MTDPILLLPYRAVFLVLGTTELIIAAICLFGNRLSIPAVMVASLVTSFLIYRIGLIWIGHHKPCPCLGSLTDALRIPSPTVDTTIKIILVYLLISSYATMFWLWQQNRRL